MLVDESAHFVDIAIDNDVESLVWRGVLFDVVRSELFRHGFDGSAKGGSSLDVFDAGEEVDVFGGNVVFLHQQQ